MPGRGGLLDHPLRLQLEQHELGGEGLPVGLGGPGVPAVQELGEVVEEGLEGDCGLLFATKELDLLVAVEESLDLLEAPRGLGLLESWSVEDDVVGAGLGVPVVFEVGQVFVEEKGVPPPFGHGWLEAGLDVGDLLVPGWEHQVEVLDVLLALGSHDGVLDHD